MKALVKKRFPIFAEKVWKKQKLNFQMKYQ